eukprot:1732214-Amphidinium_carterae.1
MTCKGVHEGRISPWKPSVLPLFVTSFNTLSTNLRAMRYSPNLLGVQSKYCSEHKLFTSHPTRDDWTT